MGWKHGGTAYAELYDGEWKDGVPHGHGRSTYIRVVDSDEEGAIPCDSPVDFAPAVNAVVNVYVGQHCQGQRDGVGVFYYADGSTYEGEWKAGKKCGSGSFTTSIGTLVKGTYENDELVGGEERHADPIDMSLVPEVFISDMCGLSDGSLEQLNATMNSLLLRYNTVLKTLFSQYCVKKEDVTFINTDKNWWKLRLPGQITIPQFLRLLSDNRIINGPVTLSTVLRCVVHTLDVFERQNGNREGSEAYAQRRKDIYELKGTINYRTFTECLVRLAPHVCVGSTFVTLGDKFNAMMEANFSLSEHPVCPLTRKYEDALRPLAGDLIDLFNTLVDLELNNGERFLPVRSFITLIAGVLAEHKTEVGAVVQYMFPYNLYSDEVNVPPGINQPHTMLNYQLYRTSCGAQETNLVASVCSTLLLTMVDFIEALVKLAYELCVTAAPGSIDENIVNFIRSKILTLNPM
ncbi:hypothetical protein AGDE_09022 [Angomonas deanei]|uniref:MORN repeat, putative n=1 Tax=Angomonas deanei TaxID=59799 RepID=A0A7G2CUG0_9TRYP|nr:hypothetical protein AGDE_09022 [Angomonas deanei]CAD2222867.1 MORN repeat, putative [Angomonas deanei]|eukprot:EPY31498.1 hypothetical protein AGDE_09022 [Angomonas deanei]